MLAPAKPSGDMSTAELLDRLASHGGKPLVFHYDGRDVRPGYHVTEVKSGAFSALDCGANPESWHETFIQLWDVEGEHRGHMPVGKFLAIMRKVAETVTLQPDARLTFEVSDGVRPMQLYKADGIDVESEVVRVRLMPRASSCKPRDRWLESESCGRQGAKDPCCG